MPETTLKNHKPAKNHTAKKFTLGFKEAKSVTIYSVEKSHEEPQLRKAYSEPRIVNHVIKSLC